MPMDERPRGAMAMAVARLCSVELAVVMAVTVAGISGLALSSGSMLNSYSFWAGSSLGSLVWPLLLLAMVL